MSRVHDVARRYAAVGSLMKHGASIFAIGDPAGAQLNRAIRRTLFTLGEEKTEVWDTVLPAATMLRWRRMTQPQPRQFQTEQPLIDSIVQHANRFRTLVSHGYLLDLLAEAANTVGEVDSPIAAILLESIKELEPGTCVVIAHNRSARAGLASWLDNYGVTVLIPSELDLVDEAVETSYVVAPPIFMPASVNTAPVTPELTFLMPTWFTNHSVPSTALSDWAEGRIVINAKVHLIGDEAEPDMAAVDDVEDADAYIPQPKWDMTVAGDREPTRDEVYAWKLHLAGGYAMWLDDGDRIRSLDPRQPEGDRLGYEAVSGVAADTYLVLREGEAERGALYKQALAALGAKASGVEASQTRWKSRLEERLAQVGVDQAIRQLDRLGVRASSQVHAWADPLLICPQRDADFALLLDWLEEPSQLTFENAVMLRRAVHMVSAALRRDLEIAAGAVDLKVLERDGIIRLNPVYEGSRGIIVARVLARAPVTQIVSRNHVRVPFKDGSAQWLE